MYNVILNPYNNIKSRIVYNDSVSNFFPCLNGVRQCEHLYSFLFALYLIDLDTFLTSTNAQGVKSISEDFENDLQIDVKLFTILYADDTVQCLKWTVAQSPNATNILFGRPKAAPN